MTKKEKCGELMSKFFGPATAKMIDSMSEDEVVEKCKEKVKAFLGEDKAKEFDSIA
jgi:monoamine oxidase